MLESLRKILKTPGLRQRLLYMAAILLALHIVILVSVIANTPSHPTLLGLALLAYGLGLRHAVDADHIAAIDNTTRKLMQDGKHPVGVGFFFALGHSTIVVVMCALVAISASVINNILPAFKETGALISASVSATFLIVIGVINLIILIDTFKIWRQVVNGGSQHEVNLDNHLSTKGLLSRILRPMLRIVDSSWSMFWIGLMFGLGFDTASEVALLSISGSTGMSTMPFWVLMLVPFSFAAGMSLIDTLDGVLMLGAYGWAFLKPARKLYYNVSITLTSVVIALFIGGVEALQIISKHTGATGSPWDFANGLQLDNWGFYIIGLFLLSWIGSMLIYKWRRYDERISD